MPWRVFACKNKSTCLPFRLLSDPCLHSLGLRSLCCELVDSRSVAFPAAPVQPTQPGTMDAIIDTLVSISNENLPQTADDLRDQGQADVAERICTCVNFTIPALRRDTATVSSLHEVNDHICSCELIVAEVEGQAKQASGWKSQAWQELKIYAHMCAACLHALAGPAANVQHPEQHDHAASSAENRDSSKQCAQDAKLQHAWYHTDRALMSGCPFSLVAPIIHLLQQFKPMPGEQQVPEGCRWIQPSEDMSAMDAPGGADITRVNINDIKSFRKEFWKQELPVIISGEVDTWAASEKWKDLAWWCTQHGHRTVPLEVGAYRASDWHEAAETLSSFAGQFLGPSIACDQQQHMGHETCAAQSESEPSIQTECSKTSPGSSKSADGTKVAYLAQHRLLEQIPCLWDDIQEPSLWSKGYEVVNMWMGTRATETPLHFDSYDNFLCQVCGSKYVRLYAPDQTRFLYVSRHDQQGSMRSSQGNVSDVCVEVPDLEKHSMFTSAVFSHAMLRPGDLLFIPARYWHYVRSTSTSISVNFWF